MKKTKNYGILLIIGGIALFLRTYIFDKPDIPYFNLLSFLWGAVLFLGFYKIVESNRLKETLKSFTIQGWLLFFLSLVVGFVCGTIAALVIMCVSFPEFVLVREICMNILTNIIFPIYVVYVFFKVTPNAVFLGKAYLVLKVLQYPLMYCISKEINTPSMVIDGSFALIGFLYLTYSNQIQILFPKEQHKVFKIDKIIIAIVALTIIIPYVIVIFRNDSTVFTLLAVSENEYTDGRIVFEKPLGLPVEKMTEGNETFFRLTQNDKISMTIYSAFDNTDTQEYFDKTMSTWSDKTFEDFEFDIKDEQHYIRNGNSIYFRTLQYFSEPTIEWTFVVIFNKETSKSCLLSCFSIIETEFMSDLIESIRFK